ncbi:MAG: hypothetical protein OXI33_09765 [Chloroflexota bacterium]|nr:hypothetical protein [Chloroflexota bacterium]
MVTRTDVIISVSAAFIVVAFIASWILFRDGPEIQSRADESWAEVHEGLWEQGKAIGRFRTSDEYNQVALRVNGQPVRMFEILERRGEFDAGEIAWAEHAKKFPVSEFSKLERERVKRYGTEVKAVAAAIAHYAEYTTAVSEGHEALDYEVFAELNRRRDIYNQSITGELTLVQRDLQYEAYIAEIGVDKFFNEVLPHLIAQQIAIEKWYIDAERGAKTSREQYNIRNEAGSMALHDARVEIVDLSALDGVSLEEVYSYIAEYEASEHLIKPILPPDPIE